MKKTGLRRAEGQQAKKRAKKGRGREQLFLLALLHANDVEVHSQRDPVALLRVVGRRLAHVVGPREHLERQFPGVELHLNPVEANLVRHLSVPLCVCAVVRLCVRVFM